MAESEHLSRVIGSIYDSALDANLWPNALEAICGFVPADMANMFYQDIADHSVRVFYSWGVDPAYEQSYLETYAALNPLFPAASFLDIDSVHAMSDMMSVEEFKETRLYREWVQPQGILDAIYANLERTATGAAAIATRRLEKDGLFDEESKRRFALLLPHVRRAVAIGKVIEFHKTGHAALANTFDRLTAAVLLVTQDGRIVFANAPAVAMLERGDMLRATQHRLSAANPATDLELHDAIAAASRGDASLGVKGIAISLAAHSGISHVAHILSLTSGKRSDPTSRNATAAVFVRPVSLHAPSSLELATKSHKLTATETRVLSVLHHTGGIVEIAQSLGITAATVKTHLTRLYAKTGTKRQSDLVRLLAKLPQEP